jgi:hypothetical protein
VDPHDYDGAMPKRFRRFTYNAHERKRENLFGHKHKSLSGRLGLYSLNQSDIYD